MDFTGQVAVVTGGGSGIGQACAREFATRRAAVAVVDRDATAGEKTASELRGKEVPPSSSPPMSAARPRLRGWFQRLFHALAASMFW